MEPQTSQAQWTVLVYLAGDNNLEGAAVEDVNEMEVVGSHPGAVEIVVQIDRAADYDRDDNDWRSTRRYYITHGTQPNKITSPMLADLGGTNTGDPAILKDFIEFTVQRYPAGRYCLILWNHGSGFYVPPEMLSSKVELTGREITMRAAPKLRRSMFASSRAEILSLPPRLRAICYDDGSSDCLDNKELQSVLRFMRGLIGRPVEVLGMDACLMTMLEVAYQVRDAAHFLVGSEETEPADGWPYHSVLNDLVENPAMTPEGLSETLVHRYIESYKKPGLAAQDVTQAAMDLAKLDDLVSAVDGLARLLLSKLPRRDLEGAIHAAWRRSPRFFDNYYVDLHRLAVGLAETTSDGAVQRACREVADAIEGKGVQTPIVAEGHLGVRMEKVRGLSIYFPPFTQPSVYYKELDFANETRWGEFLDMYLKDT